MEQNSLRISEFADGVCYLLTFSYFHIISRYSDLKTLLPSSNFCFVSLLKINTRHREKVENLNCTKHLKETYRKSTLMLLIKEHVENLATALQKYHAHKSLKSKHSQMQLIQCQLCLMCEAGDFCSACMNIGSPFT